MKSKLPHALWSLPAGSIPMRKGTTLLSNEGYSLPMASKFGAHPGTPKCNGLQTVCVSPQSMGFGRTPFFHWKGQFFPSLYSWCGAFDPNVHIITYKLKAACIWDRLRFTRNTKIVLNTGCSKYSIQGEGEPRRRVPRCSLPKLRDDDPLNPSLTPDPLLLCVRGKSAPDDSYPHFYTACEAHDDVHWWHKDSIIKCWTSSRPSEHGKNWWEMGGGKLGMLVAPRHMSIGLYKTKLK